MDTNAAFAEFESYWNAGRAPKVEKVETTQRIQFNRTAAAPAVGRPLTQRQMAEAVCTGKQLKEADDLIGAQVGLGALALYCGAACTAPLGLALLGITVAARHMIASGAKD